MLLYFGPVAYFTRINYLLSYLVKTFLERSEKIHFNREIRKVTLDLSEV